MTKQWKQSLKQSDILSDGTPFDGANIDAAISSAGATKSDIADGSESGLNRFQTIYSGGLTGTQPDRITVGGSGATPSFNQYGVRIIGTSNGDHGRVTVGSLFLGQRAENKTGSVLIKSRWGSDVNISSLTARIITGLAKSGDNPDSNDNIACFRPHVGDNTNGNVRVDASGTDSDGTLSYPDLTKMHTYTVLMDFAGNYLNANTTGFYIDSDPRRGDTADETIPAVPDVFGADQPFGLFYAHDGDNQYCVSDYLEVAVRQ